MMKIRCLSCEALARLVYFQSAYSPAAVDVEILRLGLHNTPDVLRSTLQARIDALQGSDYAAIALAYGLCGRSTNGLVARDIPLVIPRAHDCITLFLGARARYQDEFENRPGTYWYALDYLQRREDSGTVLSLGASSLVDDLQKTRREYVEKFGEDNADYLMTIMGAWQQHYQRAVYVDMGVGNGNEVEELAQNDARARGWAFERMQGDMVLIRKLLVGEWDEDFQVLQPGQMLDMSYDENILCAAPAGLLDVAPGA
jgi:hypothetical protein